MKGHGFKSWLGPYSNVITGCLKVYAIQIAVWREQVLDGLKVMRLCLNAHEMDDCIGWSGGLSDILFKLPHSLAGFDFKSALHLCVT